MGGKVYIIYDERAVTEDTMDCVVFEALAGGISALRASLRYWDSGAVYQYDDDDGKLVNQTLLGSISGDGRRVIAERARANLDDQGRA